MFIKYNFLQIIFSLLAGILIGVGFLLFSYPLKALPISLIILFSLASFSLVYLGLTKNTLSPFLQLNNAAKGFSFAFMIILATILTLALKGPQLHLRDNSILVTISIYITTVLFFFLIIFIFVSKMVRINTKVNTHAVPRFHILYFSALPLVISIIYFRAFYPGILVIDSVNQWQQAHSTFYNNWHPVMITWLIKLTTLIWDNPASFVILQFTITSVIIGYILYSFEKLGVQRWILIIGWLFLSIFPLFPMYSVTIWKDTLFSYFFLLFTVILIQIIHSKGKVLHSFGTLILLYVSLFGVIFFRHNGWPVLLATIIVFFIFLRKNYFRMYAVFFLVIITYLVITGPVYKSFNVFPAEPTESYGIPLQQVGRVIKDEGNLTEEQRQFFNRVFPLNEWKQKYHRAEVDPVKFSGHFDKEFLKKNNKEFFANWLAVVKQNPKLALHAFFDEIQLAWKLYIPQQELRPIFRYKAFTTYRPVYFLTLKNIEKYHPDYKTFNYNDYGSNKANLKLSKMIQIFNAFFVKGLMRVVLMPAFYLYLIVLLLFVLVLKGHWVYLMSAVPFILNIGSMIAAMPAQDPRYFYANFLLIVPFLFLATLLSRK